MDSNEKKVNLVTNAPFGVIAVLCFLLPSALMAAIILDVELSVAISTVVGILWLVGLVWYVVGVTYSNSSYKAVWIAALLPLPHLVPAIFWLTTLKTRKTPSKP